MGPLYIMIEGLDGSGKGVALEGLKEWADSKGYKILDMREYWKHNPDYPSEDDLKNHDVLITYEPTGSKKGKELRENLIKKGSGATPSQIADAFADDRKEHYEKLIIPAIQSNMIILQDRGVLSSLAYQSLMDAKLSVDYLMNLEGNWLALENAPDLIIITDVSPLVALERLDKRKKNDDAVFEELEFQKKLLHQYKSEEVKDIFETRETRIVFFDTNPPKTPEDTKKGAVEILEQQLSHQDQTGEDQS